MTFKMSMLWKIVTVIRIITPRINFVLARVSFTKGLIPGQEKKLRL